MPTFMSEEFQFHLEKFMLLHIIGIAKDLTRVWSFWFRIDIYMDGTQSLMLYNKPTWRIEHRRISLI